MTATEVLAQKKTDSVLGRGLAEMAEQNKQQPTSLTPNEEPQKSLEELKVEIKFHLRQMAGHAVEIGNLLIQAKEKIGHGKFGKWLEDNFQLKWRMANNFMNIAERFGNSHLNANLNQTQKDMWSEKNFAYHLPGEKLSWYWHDKTKDFQKYSRGSCEKIHLAKFISGIIRLSSILGERGCRK